MNVNKKILQYLDYKNVSQREFTSKCDLSEGVLRRGKNIGSGYLKNIKTNYPDLNFNWVLFDEGNMLLEADNLAESGGQMLGENPMIYQKVCANCESLKEIIKAKDETIGILKHQLGINGKSKAS